MHPPHATVAACSSSIASMIPPQHPDTLRGKRGVPAAHQRHQLGTNLPPRGSIQQVYAADAKTVLCFDAEDIQHVPRSGLHVKKLVLCAHHDATDPASCPKGNRCKYVHSHLAPAAVAALPAFTVHNNIAWRGLEDVEYPTHQPGVELRVASPDGGAVTDVMDSSYVLKTKALTTFASGAPGTHQLRHCAHYYYNRTCILGPDCHFVHAVFIDPKACKNQRAPAPRQLAEHAAPADEAPAAAPPAPLRSGVCLEAPFDALVAYAHRERASPADSTSTSPRPKDLHQGCDGGATPIAAGYQRCHSAASSAPSTPCAGNAVGGSSPPGTDDEAVSPFVCRRYRHDPYSACGVRCVSRASFSSAEQLSLSGVTSPLHQQVPPLTGVVSVRC